MKFNHREGKKYLADAIFRIVTSMTTLFALVGVAASIKLLELETWIITGGGFLTLLIFSYLVGGIETEETNE